MAVHNSRTNRWEYDTQKLDQSGSLQVPELIMLGYDHFTEAMPLSHHEHDGAYEFVLTDSGKVTWEVDGQLFETRAGELFHTRPNEPHRARMDFMEPCSIWWLIVRNPSSCTSWLGLSEDELREMMDKLNHLPRIVRTNTRMKISFDKLRHALETEEQPWLKLKVRHYMLDLILLMTEPSPEPQIPEDLHDAMLKAVENIRMQPEKHWVNKEIAASVGVSESHFYRLFRQTFGQSPSSFVERTRVEYAAQLLSHSPISITRLAADLEFKSSQHFSTVFKKVTGVTPSHWRTAQRKSIE
ncbi:helix-turn-helix transcriptional regulator [Paenibacillus glycanilyticus]|uniref:HTH araC/xylS-type domain-containing protein n=1 Tax=Paenibacillus glycanilyticus TaxID=126569 RepID=A0ABQ6GI55_9BACL|nr:AraC family transcriptional regulator [Paenibacillus glycanilyticus]GLX70629.1 hypothetical protein MU1_49750 [Paenibacillus glycanilyticus]